MRNMKNAVMLTAMLAGTIGSATDAAAEKSFFCKATTTDIGGQSITTLSGPLVYDMGIVGSCTNVQWSTFFDSKCLGPAKSKCSEKATLDGNYNSAAFWCAKGVPSGTWIGAYAAVSTGKYHNAMLKAELINKPAVTNTTYSCPAGTWLDNPSTGNGNRARCIRTSATAVAGVPAHPAWVSIGANWASATGPAWLTDDKGNVWYGVPATANTVVVSAADCRWKP